MSTTTSEVWPVIRRRAVTGDARSPESSHARTASITCVRDICVTSGSYTNEMAGMFATDVMGTFCPLVGCINTCCGGDDEQAARLSTATPANNFFMLFPYVNIVRQFNVGRYCVVKI